MPIKITSAAGKLTVSSPFNDLFPPRARNLGGKWDGTAWAFDARVEADVRALCIELYGTDGAAAADVVDVRVVVPEGVWQSPFKTNFLTVTLAGRPVARAYDRDSGAKTLDGVIVRKGGWTSGGSRKNPSICFKASDTEVEVLDVPRAAVEALITEYPDMISIIPREAAAPEASEAPAWSLSQLSDAEQKSFFQFLRDLRVPEDFIDDLKAHYAV